MRPPRSTRRSSLTYRVISAVCLGCALCTCAHALDIAISSNTTWDLPTYSYDNITVTSGATLTIQGAVQVNALNLTIDPGSAVAADGTGHPADQGPGAGGVGSGSGGGGYGGRGGDARTGLGGSIYGSAVHPTDLGSGGGSGGIGTGGAGGGAIRLVITNTLTLNGIISSDGAQGIGYGGGGGSGGSVFIEAGHLTGAGRITADGGDGSVNPVSAGGGGGRVAVHYQTSAFTGTASAGPGTGTESVNEEPGTLGFFDTDDATFHSGHSWRFHVDDGPFALSTYTLAADSLATIEDGVVFAGASLVLESNAQLFPYAGSRRVSLELVALTIQQGALASADATGYSEAEGPGTSPYFGTGGGYGGLGGQNRGEEGGRVYGSALEPMDLGSGAGPGGIGTGGSGGGAVRLVVSGTLTLGGTITANGGNGMGYDAGGGSGGSVLVEAGHLTGVGTITANGGNGATGGQSAGGGGGRVAVHYGMSDFSGAVTVDPGSGYLSDAGQPGTIGFVDTSTDTLYTGSTWRFELIDSEFPANLVVPNGSVADMRSGRAYTFTDVTIGSGGSLVSTDGFPGEEGPGAGISTIASGGGGGYGGRGGDSTTGSGGDPYGSAAFPIDRGSGGGSADRGGQGGGAIRLIVENALRVDGVLAANGSDAVTFGGGGGSGGSLYVTTDMLSGDGFMEAKGGNAGSGYDGGGGGGRVAVYHNGSTFSGTIDVSGGTGFETGADGSALLIEEIPLVLGEPLELDVEPFAFSVFRLELGAGDVTNLVARLTPLVGDGSWEFVGRLGEQPGLAEYDWLPAPTASEPYSILLPTPVPGTYYFGVYFAEWAKQPARFRIDVFSAERYVAGLNAGYGGNGGVTTVEIGGLGYEDGISVELRDSSGTMIRQFTPSFYGQDSLSVALNLQGLNPQTVDIAVIWPDTSEIVLDGAFDIIEGTGGGELEVRLVMNETVRSGRVNTLWIEYENVGDSDLLSPILELEVEESYVQMRPDRYSPWQTDPIQYLAIDSEGLASVLAPGSSNRIPIQYLSTGAAHSANTFVVNEDISDDTSMDYDTLKPLLRPAGVSEELWNLVWPAFTEQLGNTWGAYLTTLRSGADYLSQLGEQVPCVSDLIDFELRKLNGHFSRAALASAMDATSLGPNMPIIFVRTYVNDTAARFHEGPFGWGWTHSYDLRVVDMGDDIVGVFQGGQPLHLFYLSQDGDYAPLRGRYAELSENGGGFTLSVPQGIEYAFDAQGKFLSLQDRYGSTVAATYDGDNLVGLIHSNGDQFELSYDGTGLITTLVDHAGRTTTYAYTDGHLTSVTRESGFEITYAYDSTADSLKEHALTTITLPDGNMQCFSYDTNGRLVEEGICGPEAGPSFTYTYGATGAVDIEGAGGFVVMTYPDNRGNSRHIVNSAGHELTLDYDALDELTELVDTAGNRFLFEYDHEGRIVHTVNPIGGETHHTYDTLLDSPLSSVDPNNNETRFELDAQGNFQQVLYPDGTSQSVVRDAQGTVTSFTDRAGAATTATRNARGQVTAKQLPEGPSEAFAYDGVGRLVSTTDIRGDATVITYSNLDSIDSIVYPDGNGFTYEYNENELLTRRTGPDGFVLDYGYDSEGRLETVVSGSDTLIQYQYDNLDRVIGELRGNGTYSTYAYDDTGLLSVIVHYADDDSVQRQFQYTYDSRGNPVDIATLDGTWTYEYDAMNRLVSYSTPDGFWETYDYDLAGNRVIVTNGNGAEAYTTNEMNQYTQVGNTAYTYDAKGNLTAKTGVNGTTTYQYDSQNRLLSVMEEGGSTYEYTYDALGHPISQTVDGVTTYFVSDPLDPGDVTVVLDEVGDVQARYIFGLGLAAMVDASGDVSYSCFDSAGNTRLITGPDGSIVGQYDYAPYGELLNAAKSGPFSPFLSGGIAGDLTLPHGQILSGGAQIDPLIGRDIAHFAQSLEVKDRAVTYKPQLAPVQRPRTQVVRKNVPAKTTGRPVHIRKYRDFMYPHLPFSQRARSFGAFYVEFGKEMYKDIFNRYIDKPLGGVPGKVVSGAGRVVHAVGRASWWVGDNTFGKAAYHATDLGYALRDFSVLFFSKLPPDIQREIIRDIRKSKNLLADDPNEKVGPPGEGDGGYVSGEEPFVYTIYFENKPTASAPAQEVFVTDILDANLDLSTFRITEITWGDHFVDIPPDVDVLYSRETVPDHRPNVGKSWWVDVTVERDGAQVDWTFRTLDPETGELPEDALAGFLPPNISNGIGEGHVSFSIWPKPGLNDGTTITNEASIVFDTNDPIVTNAVFNIIGEPAPGDVNGSGTVNAVDVQLVINAALSLPVDYNCDINADDAVDAVDVQLVINAALGT